jgi:hypothetical protein
VPHCVRIGSTDRSVPLHGYLGFTDCGVLLRAHLGSTAHGVLPRARLGFVDRGVTILIRIGFAHARLHCLAQRTPRRSLMGQGCLSQRPWEI